MFMFTAVTNRWGYVQTRAPEKTTDALVDRSCPERYWLEINALLVPFGKHICTGVLPRCSTCPVLDMCRQQVKALPNTAKIDYRSISESE
jgi:endonuclease III